METRIRRHWYHDECTMGLFFIEYPDALTMRCYTLEDKMREVVGQAVSEWKVPKQTAIPCGRFQLIVDYSTRFKKYMFHVLNVPGFDGIRVHSGNDAEDTEGCPLVGNEKTDHTILQSRAALTILFSELTVQDGWDDIRNCARFKMKEETWITVENGQALE